MGKKRRVRNEQEKPAAMADDAPVQEADSGEEELSNLAPLLAEIQLDNPAQVSEQKLEDKMDVDEPSSKSDEEFNPRIKDFEPQPVPRAFTGGLLTREPTEDEIEQQRKEWEEKIKEPTLELESWKKNKAFLEAQRYTPNDPGDIKSLAFLIKPVDDFDYSRKGHETLREQAKVNRQEELKNIPKTVTSFLADKAAVRELRNGIRRGTEVKLDEMNQRDQELLEMRKRVFKAQ